MGTRWMVGAILLSACAGGLPPSFAVGAARVDACGAAFDGMHVGLAAMGRDELAPVQRGTTTARDGVVEIARGAGVAESWRSVAGGLEQVITIAERPDGEGPLALAVATGTRTEGAGDAIALLDRDGAARATYSHLAVLDADGRRVSASMRADGDRVRIEIDDAAARYPLVVDPLVIGEEAMLVSSTLVPAGSFGAAVAIDGTGTRAIVGAPNEGGGAGSARIYVRNGSLWTEEARFAVGTLSTSRRGTAVAISGDGAYAMEGSPTDGPGGFAGAYTLMRRDGTSWSPLLNVVGSSSYRFGESVALDDDASIVVHSWSRGQLSTFDSGLVNVAERSGTTWVAGDQITGSDSLGSGDLFGLHVAVSGDGNYVLVADGHGEVYAFLRQVMSPRNVYTESHLVDPPSNEAPATSLAIDRTGARALVGLPTTPGSVRVFVRTGATTWATEATLTNGSAGFGASVSISSDGTRALVGDVTDASGAGAVRLYVRSGTTWTADATGLASDRAPGDRYGARVSISGDGSRGIVGAPSDTVGGATTAGSARIVTIRRPNGDACTSPDQCGSGSCADGFCCDLFCGGSAVDCQACAAALTGVTNGTCAPLSAAMAPTVTCRAASGLCDVAERCEATSRSCPADAVMDSGTICRDTTGICDAAEVCDGASGACPGNVRAAPGTPCRPPAGPCDITEVCDGANGECPPDAFLSASITCRNSVGPCDIADLCDGTSALCPEALAASGTICNAFMLGPCDAPDTCTGSSADCPPAFLAGVDCRASEGTCDVAEVCTGASIACPPDGVAAAGVPCRVASGMVCDVTEACDGVSGLCPADVPFCGDAGVLVDAGIVSDGGAPDAPGPAVATGSSCSAGHAHGPAWIVAVALLLLGRRRS